MPKDGTDLHNYELKKAALIAELKAANARGEPIRLNKKTSNLFRTRKEQGKGLDVSQFNQVIAVDPHRLRVNVEGMTTYDSLVKACLKHHCLPAVVPQLKTITVGGAFTGCGIESTSFKFGLVHETVLECELLLADGRVVVCTADNEYKDLFFGFPNSYGTLGYALRLVLALYPVKDFVKLSYQRFSNKEAYFKSFQELCLKRRQEQAVSFIEGVVFSKEALYLCQAEFVDKAPYCSDYTYMNQYYQSISNREDDYLKTYDYIWRWDTDWFWCSRVFYLHKPWLRYLFGRKYLNSATYSRLRLMFSKNRLAMSLFKFLYGQSESVIQDVQIPVDKAENFLTFFEDKVGITPIWICPTMPYNSSAHYPLYAMTPEVLYLNFGFWESIKSQKEEGYYNRLIEKKVVELSGKKSLYSSSYYTEQEFAAQYNQEAYQELKSKYDEGKKLRSLFDKCLEK